MEMKLYKIGDLYTVSNGLSKGKAFFGQGYPFLTFSEVMNNFFVPNTLISLVQTEINERAKFSIQRGDIFLNRTSETANELGISCVALKDHPNATFNGFCKRLRPIGEDVVPEYIGYYMRTNAFRKHMLALTGSMITRASLRNEQLLSIEIELPSKENQLKIAHFLRQYDLLIDNCKKQIALLEEAAQRLFHEWFVDLRFPGHESTVLGDNGLPVEWKNVGILDVYNIAYGKTLATKYITSSGTYPVYGSSKCIGYFDKKTVDDYKVLITSRGNAGTIHRTYHKESFVTNNSFIVTPKTEYDYIKFSYIYYSLIALDLSRIVNGSAQQQLTNAMLENVRICLPHKDLISEFGKICDKYIDKANALYGIIEYCNEAKKSLIPRLISGQIEINA